jgi:basic membrane protein A
MPTKLIRCLALLLIASTLLAACGGAAAAPTPVPEKPKVAVLMGSDGPQDHGFNEYTLKGARESAEAAGLEFTSATEESNTDHEKYIEDLVAGGADLVITVGFQLADATASAARKYPNIKFAIVDTAYSPGFGCPDTVTDCYTAEGGLANVTSLMFAEDEIGYLAGVLAACMSKTNTVGTVAGMELPPVKRFVVGFQNGAKSVKPDVVTLNQYIPDFSDPATGKAVGEEFIGQGADVLFGVGGSTGNGGLMAAKEAGVMAIGVDVDQYLTYPEVKDALMTSAMKNVDIAAANAVRDFAAGKLESGVRLATVASGGVGLAPYHDWEDRITPECKAKVDAAAAAIKADPKITGGK